MASAPSVERHPTLYFPNGDVVLSAQASIHPRPLAAPPKTQLFRVHKFLLTHHSVTFANMFADANPASGESYDGVPMVELQGDKAEDVALLLNYLYNPTQMTFRRFDPNTSLVVSGVIRLADKYCIESLREHLINIVASDWPTTLEEWDFFQAEIQAVKDKLATTNLRKKEVGGEGYEPLSEHLPEPASAIAFGHEFGCRQILRAAYYSLLTISPRYTWDSSWRTSSAGPLCARWALLDADSLLRYMKGLESVLIHKPWVFELLSKRCSSRAMPISDPAFSRHSCVCVLQGLISSVWSYPIASERDPLGMLLELQERAVKRDENHPGELCADCCWGLPDMIADIRRDVWDKLYHDFTLDELPQ
ncbi:hypothetical protein V8D89_000375 [Ganoderma adspersum]